VAQPLEIGSSDSTMHNVHGMPETNREFNSAAVAGMKNRHVHAPEVLIPFKCDVHAGCTPTSASSIHPYFAVSGQRRKFELKTIPPGTYTIEACTRSSAADADGHARREGREEITFTFKAQ
jgi:hypothetical protein